MEAFVGLICCGLFLIFIAIILSVVGMIQDKLNAWLAQRALNKK